MKAAKFIQFTLLRLLHIQLDSNLPLFLPTFCTKLHCLFLSTMFSFSFSSELLPQVFLIRFFLRLSCDVKKVTERTKLVFKFAKITAEDWCAASTQTLLCFAVQCWSNQPEILNLPPSSAIVHSISLFFLFRRIYFWSAVSTRQSRCY